jgi:KDO2-lipid IV(A) lauroyltransferase
MARHKGKLQIYAEYYAARIALGAIGVFPFAWSLKIGEMLSFIPYKFAKRLRFVGFRNLELALPELSRIEHEKILRDTFKSLGRQLGTLSHLSRLTLERVRELVDIDGIEHFQGAVGRNQGKILVTGHFGGWELSHIVASAYGFPVNVVARRLDNPLLENLMETMRTGLGSRTIDKKASARTMLRLLQKKEFIGILADLNTQEYEGIFVDFFGLPASTTTGPAKLALYTDAAILPAFAVWQKDKRRYLLKACEPLEMPKSEDMEENIKILTQSMTAKIEEFIRAYPDQWMWIHKRWNTQPPGKPNLYAKDFQTQNLKSEVRNPKSEIKAKSNRELEVSDF